MAVCPAGQSASNMLRRTLAVLQLCGLLAACGCVVIRRDAYPGQAISIDCSRDGNSTACETSNAQGIRSTSGQTSLRVSRQVEGGSFEGDGDVDEGEFWQVQKWGLVLGSSGELVGFGQTQCRVLVFGISCV